MLCVAFFIPLPLASSRQGREKLYFWMSAIKECDIAKLVARTECEECGEKREIG